MKNEILVNKSKFVEKAMEATKDNFLRLGGLQFFSENPEGGEGGEDTPPEDNPKDKTFTQSEVDSSISKAVDSALKKQQAKLDKEIEERIETERKEAARLAKLSEKEREKEKLSQREKAADKREAELAKKELLADAESDLREKDLPTSFAPVLLGEDAETTLKNINTFKETFDSAVNDAVKAKLRQDTPPAGTGSIKGNNSYNVAEMARNARIIK